MTLSYNVKLQFRVSIAGIEAKQALLLAHGVKWIVLSVLSAKVEECVVGRGLGGLKGYCGSLMGAELLEDHQLIFWRL